MLAVLCTRPKPLILGLLAHFYHAGSFSAHQSRLLQSPIHFSDSSRRHSTACSGSASVWHVIQPSGFRGRSNIRRPAEPRGEGSWNVAWDARPARWLHRPDSAWLLFGVCACLSPIEFYPAADKIQNTAVSAAAGDEGKIRGGVSDEKSGGSGDYKVTGVAADGRCLFRAIAHGACLRSGEDAPDEYRQTELADQLRAQVVEELVKRRKEIEWFIEEDFDAYIKRIQQPFVWGGEPELLMACHVLKTMISVFMIERKSGNLVNIANYGEEYQKDQVNPINVLFHGYGHYDILETISGLTYQKVNM